MNRGDKCAQWAHRCNSRHQSGQKAPAEGAQRLRALDLSISGGVGEDTGNSSADKEDLRKPWEEDKRGGGLAHGWTATARDRQDARERGWEETWPRDPKRSQRAAESGAQSLLQKG